MLDPQSHQMGSTTDHPERKHSNKKIFVELPLELSCVICTGIIGTCNCFGSICESRGLSNLKTREIKTI